jgi:hypothetical protein
VWKYGDGKFIRIPKGRTSAVIQNAIEQVMKESSGEDEADWNEFWKLVAENLAPNNPFTDNMFAPLRQISKNETWYGEEIVPTRLQDLPVEEQFDEKTDAFSIAIGQFFGVSPKKFNYFLDQYGGVLGDTFLPMSTPKAESPIDNPLAQAFAPLRDIFTTDSVLNNRVTGDFYETLEAAEAKAESKDATREDKLISSFLIYNNAEISKLMQEQRDIQTSDLPNSEKYARNRELKERINEMQEKALDALDDVSVNGIYAELGDKRFNFDKEDDRWYEITPKKSDGEDNWHYQQEQRVTKAFGVSYDEYWNNKEKYNDAFYIASGYDNEAGGEQSCIETAKSVFGISKYADFATELADIKADKDKNGNPINGSRKKKVKEYIYGLDIPEIEKHILFKTQYPYTNTYNYQIVEYLDKNDNISYDSFFKILDELGYKVDSNKRVTW